MRNEMRKWMINTNSLIVTTRNIASLYRETHSARLEVCSFLHLNSAGRRFQMWWNLSTLKITFWARELSTSAVRPFAHSNTISSEPSNRSSFRPQPLQICSLAAPSTNLQMTMTTIDENCSSNSKLHGRLRRTSLPLSFLDLASGLKSAPSE